MFLSCLQCATRSCMAVDLLWCVLLQYANIFQLVKELDIIWCVSQQV